MDHHIFEGGGGRKLRLANPYKQCRQHNNKTENAEKKIVQVEGDPGSTQASAFYYPNFGF